MPDTAFTRRPVRPTGNSTTRSLTRQERLAVGPQVGVAAAGHQLTTLVAVSSTRRPRPASAHGLVRGFGTFGRADRVPAGVHVARRSRPRPAAAPPQAPLLHVRAARREAASLRRVDEIGRAAPDDLELGVAARSPASGCSCSSASVYGMPHVREQRPGRCLLHDLAGVHHGDLVGAPGHHAEVVGHEHHRHVAVLLLLLQQVEDLGLHGDVERRRGLVGEQQRGAAGEGDRDRDALAHAARQLVGVLVETPARARGCRPTSAALGRGPGVLLRVVEVVDRATR